MLDCLSRDGDDRRCQTGHEIGKSMSQSLGLFESRRRKGWGGSQNVGDFRTSLPVQRRALAPAPTESSSLCWTACQSADPTRGRDQLDITQGQTEAVIKPDRMLGDFEREAEARGRVR
jgi:hypothetical protein